MDVIFMQKTFTIGREENRQNITVNAF